MNPDTVSVLTARIDAFPILPTVVAQIMKITADPESSANDLMKVVRADQSLTIALFKMANSTFCGLTRKVTSLKQVLTILGFNKVQNLVLTKAMFNSFKDFDADGGFNMRKFWEHSFICGLVANIIGTEVGSSEDDFFVAGLIHDIGKLVIYMAMPEEFSKVIETAGPFKYRIFETEKNIIGISHDKVGMKLLKKWMFPQSLINAVGFHHMPHKEKDRTKFSMVVHIADMLSHLSESSEYEKDEVVREEEKIVYAKILSASQFHGISWSESELKRFRQELSKKKEEEVETLSTFLAM